jgi:hypothetical protein
MKFISLIMVLFVLSCGGKSGVDSMSNTLNSLGDIPPKAEAIAYFENCSCSFSPDYDNPLYVAMIIPNVHTGKYSVVCLDNGDKLKYIASFTSMLTLSFSSSSVVGDGIKYVSALVNLTELGFNSSNINNDGLKWLSGLSKLATLSILDEPSVTTVGLDNLRDLPKLTTLRVAKKYIPNTYTSSLNNYRISKGLPIVNIVYY